MELGTERCKHCTSNKRMCALTALLWSSILSLYVATSFGRRCHLCLFIFKLLLQVEFVCSQLEMLARQISHNQRSLMHAVVHEISPPPVPGVFNRLVALPFPLHGLTFSHAHSREPLQGLVNSVIHALLPSSQGLRCRINMRTRARGCRPPRLHVAATRGITQHKNVAKPSLEVRGMSPDDIERKDQKLAQR